MHLLPSSRSSRGALALASVFGLSGLLGASAASCSAGNTQNTGGHGTGGGGTTVTGGHGGASTSSSSGSTGGASTSSSSSSSGTGGVSTSSSSSGTGGTGGGDAGPPCPAGTITCAGSVEQVCDGNGGFSLTMDCAPQVCAPGIGCATCVPGTGMCNGQTSQVCKADGSGYTSTFCDPDQGLSCDATTGACVGACAPQLLGKSYIGCDYYPTVTSNVVLDNPFHFAVSVSNTTNSPANVKITQGASVINTTTVAANSVAVITLPWVSALKNAIGSTSVVAAGAYRLRSDRPVSVYQYNPLEYTLQGTFSYTNDASLLLPANAWTGNYRVAAWPTLSTGLPGFYAITASQDDTTVHVAAPAGATAAPGAGVDAAGNGTVTLNQGDVVQIFTGGSGAPGDLTGSLVAADKPVQVIGGHVCTYLPDPVCCCDHIEEIVPPIETLGTDYLVTSLVLPGVSQPGFSFVRVVATTDSTTLTYDPPVPGAPTSIATAGAHIDIPYSATDFKITASARVVVAQYMVAQQGQPGMVTGDPAMTVAVPIKQYRKLYLFHAPVTYDSNYVNVTAPNGATVMLDGAAVNGFTPIGGSGYSVARVSLSNAGNGTHSVSSTVPVGIEVYGYGQYTSYWYPGGQDLQKL